MEGPANWKLRTHIDTDEPLIEQFAPLAHILQYNPLVLTFKIFSKYIPANPLITHAVRTDTNPITEFSPFAFLCGDGVDEIGNTVVEEIDERVLSPFQLSFISLLPSKQTICFTHSLLAQLTRRLVKAFSSSSAL